MVRLGVTGGIGMGKSTSAQFLVQLGCAVVDTDQVAREVVAPGQPALAALRDAFGDGVFRPDGVLDRGRLADVVFRDAGARGRLEGILHPLIRSVWQQRLVDWRGAGVTVAAVVIPLLYETSAESEFDAVVCVACSAGSQLQRLAARGWSDEQIRGRIAAQWDVQEKVRRAQYLIWTEPPPAEHIRQIRCVLEACCWRAGRC